MTKDFRFGVNLFTQGSRSVWQDTARRVEDLGYDVLLVPDHLGMHAPFPALLSAAEVTTRPRLGTLVLNTGFYRPALLAREVAELHTLTDGRFELGLGAGWVAEEFEAAGLPFPSGRQRVDHLDHTLTEIGTTLRQNGQQVPVLVAGHGDRMLSLAAQHADIVNINDAHAVTDAHGKAPRSPADQLRERLGFLRDAAGDRFDQIELCLVISSVHITGSGEPDLALSRRLYPDLSDEELLRLPGVRHGSEQEIADALRELRDTYGITYFIAMEFGGNLDAFGKVISQFR